MAEEIQGEQHAQAGQPQQVQIMVDERDLRIIYTNTYQIYPMNEEVVLDIGFNMPHPNSSPQTGPQLLLRRTDRLIMNYASAKRLSISLGQLIKRYEQQFGEIAIQPARKPT
jgi:hypothetical protein